jgi:hypothetical protein
MKSSNFSAEGPFIGDYQRYAKEGSGMSIYFHRDPIFGGEKKARRKVGKVVFCRFGQQGCIYRVNKKSLCT